MPGWNGHVTEGHFNDPCRENGQCYINRQFNGGRMVMLQRWAV